LKQRNCKNRLGGNLVETTIAIRLDIDTDTDALEAKGENVLAGHSSDTWDDHPACHDQ